MQIKLSPKRPKVTITISWEEARTLAAICDSVGGDPETTRRRHTNDLSNMLEDVNITGDSVWFTGDLEMKGELPDE